MTLRDKNDGRKLGPHVLRSSAIMLNNGHFTKTAVAKAFDISWPSVSEISKCFGNLSVEELYAMSDNEVMLLYYPQGEQGIKHRKENLLEPDIDQCVRQVVEQDKPRTEVYDNYVNEAKGRDKAYLGRSQFMSVIREPIAAMLEKTPEGYIPQEHVYGREMQIDFSGMKVALLTPGGEVKCRMMVTTRPRSGKIDASFVVQQSTAEACRVLGALFVKYQACPYAVKVDNAKCFVTRHSHSDADLNKSFEAYMKGFKVYVDPAPCYAPQAKSAVEHSVKLVQTLVKKHLTEFGNELRTVAGHSAHLQKLIDEHINDGPFKRSSDATRTFLFAKEELPKAQALPSKIPEYRDIRDVCVSRGGTVTINKHEYSVPYIYITKHLSAAISPDTIEISDSDKVVATHVRTDGEGRTIIEEHKSDKQKAIEKNKSEFATCDDIIKGAMAVDPAVADFCRAKLAVCGSGPNELRCCTSVIRHGRKLCGKNLELYAKACTETLRCSSSLWNTYTIKDCCRSLLERSQGGHCEASSSEVVSVNSSNAFLRRSASANQDQSNKKGLNNNLCLSPQKTK